MIEKYDAVIFDMDGTLINSMWVWHEVDEIFFEKYKLSRPPEMNEELEGKSFTESAIYFIEKFNLNHTPEEIKAEWRAIAKDFFEHKITLKPHAVEFLEFLKSHQIKLGIATSNSRELAEVALKSLDIMKYFDSVKTSCEVEKGKPHPYIYEAVARELGVCPSKCLAFEDVPNGIRAGQSAGMEVWGIYDDYQDDQMRKVAKELATRWIEDYSEAIKFLKE
ncbi:MAG: HAD family hydrolase [Epulopiscium sp. Nele67-Bin005]|nr:MAG: HAD family hydrolase [Epulopiscium sp. Nele67-Bin005]